MQFLYFGLFDPAHVGHVHRIAAVKARLDPSRMVIVPLDFYDGAIPGRRIVRTKMAAALAHTTDTLYTDTGLAVRDLQALVARLARADTGVTLVLFDPELPAGQRAGDIDPVGAGVEVICDAELGLPGDLPERNVLQRMISDDHPAWHDHVADGVAPMVTQLGLYGWSPRASW